ncbi:hypothetical protein GGR53DRAFT_99456 [Hypoxylon sp. FL1150]|nr:hypothetical protein GGR53DRAFT_99456 [Hypoxylon sp. FL1150]
MVMAARRRRGGIHVNGRYFARQLFGGGLVDVEWDDTYIHPSTEIYNSNSTLWCLCIPKLYRSRGGKVFDAIRVSLSPPPNQKFVLPQITCILITFFASLYLVILLPWYLLTYTLTGVKEWTCEVAKLGTLDSTPNRSNTTPLEKQLQGKKKKEKKKRKKQTINTKQTNAPPPCKNLQSSLREGIYLECQCHVLKTRCH